MMVPILKFLEYYLTVEPQFSSIYSVLGVEDQHYDWHAL